MLTVTLIGCGGTMPLPGRALSALAVTCAGRNVLVDCGEGTQAAARASGVSLYKIDWICLTHFHGDHIFGLPGLLQTMASQGRTEPVQLAGPAEELARWAEPLLALAGPLPFPVVLRPLAGGEALAAAGGLTITAFPLSHRVPCLGYAFTLARPGRFLPEQAAALGVPRPAWKQLQAGAPFLRPDGSAVLPEQVMGPPRRGLKVVYATDTRPCPELARQAQGADLLLCDATYADAADGDKAELYGHSTFAQSAALAAAAGVRRLWLTHYSAAIPDPAAVLAPAQALYPAAVAGTDGMRAELHFDRAGREL